VGVSDSLRARQSGQHGYVLHSYPFRESSLIVEAFTRDCGRVPLVARGARRPKSALRGVLLAFQPVLLSWSGKTELRTLVKAEWLAGHAPLNGLALICGFYLNELLLRLLPRDDPHERLFDLYRDTLDVLARSGEFSAGLRRFEKNLLGELGYGLILERDAITGDAVTAGRRYLYLPERGPVLATDDASQKGVELDGQTLIDMQCDEYARTATQQQSKVLMRALINHHLGNRQLHTRQLLLDLQAL
jgi:DNA repair protein RecO (recombination protein O)